MKAIVIRQPWATLVMLGVKTIETRGFPPNGPMRPDGVRGLPGLAIERGERIAIVAGAKAPEQGLRLGAAGPIVTAEYLVDGGLLLELCNEQSWPLPLGSVLGTVRVDDALPVLPCPPYQPATDWHRCSTRRRWQGSCDCRPPEHEMRYREWLAANRPPLSFIGLGGLDGGPWLVERDRGDWQGHPIHDQLPLGDFTEGRWGWLLSDPQPLREWWCEADAIGYPTLTCTERATHGPSCGWRTLPPVPCPGKGPDGERRSLQGVFRLPDDVAEKAGLA